MHANLAFLFASKMTRGIKWPSATICEPGTWLCDREQSVIHCNSPDRYEKRSYKRARDIWKASVCKWVGVKERFKFRASEFPSLGVSYFQINDVSFNDTRIPLHVSLFWDRSRLRLQYQWWNEWNLRWPRVWFFPHLHFVNFLRDPTRPQRIYK